MKNITLLLLLFTGIVKAQIVNIPDANFKAKLIGSNAFYAADLNDNNIIVDANGDGEIQTSEALNVKKLWVGNSNISDLTGIESFTNLTILTCNSNPITALNLSSLTNLTELNFMSNHITSMSFPNLPNLKKIYCSGNQMTSLNVSNLSGLTYLYCRDNLLASLDVSNLTLLENLNAQNNKILSIDVSNLTHLTELGIGQNLLSSLDVSNLIQLNSLSCDDNALTELNVSNLVNLVYFYCYNNQITSLDVSHNTLLNDFWCYNNPITTLDVSNLTVLNRVLFSGCSQLTSLFLKNGRFETESNFTGCNNLRYVCADDVQLAYIRSQLIASGLTDTVCNSYCSFTLGGNYNTITGNVLFDYNNNGCDANDFANPYFKVNINDGTNLGSTFTTALGNYTFYTQTGAFTLTPSVENPSYFDFSPSNATVNFPLLDNSVQVQNFCVTANGLHPDLEIILVPVNRARPGFDASYKIIYKNKGNQIQSGSINLTFDDASTDFVSASPNVDNQAFDTLLWNYNNLQPFETRVINFTLNCNSSQEIPALIAGDILNFTCSINYAQGDDTPLDNVFELHQIVRNAFDPNEKTCLEGSIISPNEIGKYVHYNINFENIGNEAATNIVIKDTIDRAKFDIHSIQLLYASHPVKTKINGNIVEFIFQNIDLPPSNINPIGGHGNVLFKIKTLPTLVVGDEIANTANIYFDYNTPVATNEARSAFTTLSTSPFIKDESVSIYPNPTKNNIHMQAKNNIQSIQLFDVRGRLLQQVIENKNAATLDISHQANGVYFLKVTTDKGSAIEKVIKE